MEPAPRSCSEPCSVLAPRTRIACPRRLVHCTPRLTRFKVVSISLGRHGLVAEKLHTKVLAHFAQFSSMKRAPMSAQIPAEPAPIPGNGFLRIFWRRQHHQAHTQRSGSEVERTFVRTLGNPVDEVAPPSGSNLTVRISLNEMHCPKDAALARSAQPASQRMLVRAPSSAASAGSRSATLYR
jgi:hypothetical protein